MDLNVSVNHKYFGDYARTDLTDTVNQQILAAIKFGVSENKVIWWLLNVASPRLCSVRSTYDHVCWQDKY